MLLLDLTLETPEENLALEEAWLEEAEAGARGEMLRFWESPHRFVVLGAGGRVRDDVNMEACRADSIPIRRRCSGGGTVLQGPGCLNYALVLERAARPALAEVVGTNQHVLGRMARAVESVCPQLEIAGVSDLVWDSVKISGNAQKRKRRCILFHGTILYAAELSQISRYLREPPRQPGYRAGRTHAAFLRNVPADPGTLRHLIAQEWECTEPAGDWPRERTRSLVETRYSRDEWNLAF